MFMLRQISAQFFSYTKPNVRKSVKSFSMFFAQQTGPKNLNLPLNRTVHDNVTSINIKKRPTRKKKLTTEEEIKIPGWYNVTAFATAEEYDMDSIIENLKTQGLYDTKKIKNNDDVIHAVAKYQVGKEPREIFIFKEGSIVLWNITELEISNVLTFLRDFEQDSYSERLSQSESETMKYRYHDEEE